MINKEITENFYQIADMLDILGVPFKPQAYRRAAAVLESLSEDVSKIYKSRGQRGLDEIPGIGKNLSKKIVEYIETGKISKLDELRKQVPGDLVRIMNIKGIGPKKVKRIYNELKISTVDEFRKACEEHKIAKLKGFGPKTEDIIFKGLSNLEERRFLLGDALPIAEEIVEKLRAHAKRIEIAGSIRRRKKTNGDIDILAVAPPGIMDEFAKLGDVIVKGEKKTSIMTKLGIQVDLRVVKEDEFGSALQYFTGSKSHNIKLREIAIRKGMKLNEYGLFRGRERIAGRTEEEIYKNLGLQYIPPELRENTGEIEAAEKGKIPKLVERIFGDTHVHTKWSDGKNTIEEMAKKAIELGYEYIVITDHWALPIAHGLNETRIKKQIEEIEKLNKKFERDGFRIFSGVEANITESGVDVPNDILKELDFPIAAIHSKFGTNVTERLKAAIENPYIMAIAHPTGRIIFKRDPMEFDKEKIFEIAARNGVFMEINASPDRLDLNGPNVRLAKSFGVKFVIGSDAHSEKMMDTMLGVYTARRGWAERKDVVNASGLKDFEKMIERMKK